MSVFVNQTVCANGDDWSKEFTTAKGGVSIIAAGTTGTVGLYANISGSLVLLQEVPITCNPAAQIVKTVGANQAVFVLIKSVDCVSLTISDINSAASEGGGGGGSVTANVTFPTIGGTTVAPNLVTATTAGNTAAGLQSISISNVGAANASIDGQTVPPGATVSWNGYYNEENRAFVRLNPVAYDGTGTTLLIAETP